MSLKQEQLQWQAENDAHTVAEAAAIKSDPTRLAAAKKAATTLVVDQKKRAAEARIKASAMTNLASKTKAKAKPKPRPKAKSKPRTKKGR